MIKITWKGVETTAAKGPDGWVGPPDLDLSGFADETSAAKRLCGIVINPPVTTPVADAKVKEVVRGSA